VFTTLYRSVEIERTRYIHKYTYIWWYLDSHILQSSLQKGISRKKRKRCGRMLLSSYTIIHTLACVCSCISRYIYTFTKDFYLKKITRKLTVMVCLGEDSVKSGDFINGVYWLGLTRCVVVRCSVLFHYVVAVCCSVLQCVAVCCGALQCVAVCRSVMQRDAVCCCRVLQCGPSQLTF